MPDSFGLHAMRWSHSTCRRACGAALALPLLAPAACAQEAKDDTILLTIFLRHDQSKPLNQINAQLRQQGYYKKFPPPGIEVASWYVMMGIGEVVTLKVPASRLREVNRAVEQSAWGGYRTEFYPTYDYKAIAEEHRRQKRLIKRLPSGGFAFGAAGLGVMVGA
jgi:hypothetical protein